MSTICLNMIVKNEAAIIAETLDNILANIRIDYWVIADTGSTDDTMLIIHNFFQARGIAGELWQHEWRNFGHNRQLALDAAQNKTDYVFFFDADDRFTGRFNLPESLSATFYNLFLTNAQQSTRYPRRLLAKNDGSVMWRGVLHEVIMPRDGQVASEIAIEGDYYVVSGRFGARNQDPDKYLKDANMLAQAYTEETDVVFKRRYAYYCGQSYRDCNRPEEAIVWYQRNIQWCEKQGEEIRFSYIALANEHLRLNQHAQAIAAWWSAYNAMPENAEALAYLAQHYYNTQQHHLGFEIAQKAVSLPHPIPQKTLFVNKPVHQYMVWYELARHAIKLQRPDDAYPAARHLLQQPEYSAALNEFVLELLLLLKTQIEQDSVANAKTIYQHLAVLKMLTPNAQQHRQQLLAWFQTWFAPLA